MAPPFDIDEIEAILQSAARQRQALSYSGLLLCLGLPFSRPRMRAVCRILDAIDDRAAAAGAPALAVLVVRESDRLPGQGWWVNRPDCPSWTGPAARAHVDRLQAAAFDYWATR